jgi:hypothetical protein
MSLRCFRSLALIALSLIVLGCDQGRENPPDVFVRVLNAAPSFAALAFRREETQPSNLNYKESSVPFTYDQDQYDFHVAVNTPGVTSARCTANVTCLLDFSKEIREGTNYTFVLTEVGGTIQPVFLEQPRPATNTTDANIIALHAGETLAPMDLYLTSSSAVPLAPSGTPVASLSFGHSSAARTIAPGDYVVIATARGDPTSVLLTSTPFTLPAGVTAAFVIVEGAGQGVAPFGVVYLGQATGELVDQSTQAGLRVINGATDGAPRDVAINDQFSPPLFAAVPFATATDYKLVPPSTLNVNVTPPGNPGVLELTTTITPSTNFKHTLIFTGDAGTLTHLLLADDGRRIDADARMRFYNVATQFTLLDFYIVPPGTTDLNNFVPATLGAPGGTSLFSFVPGTYDLFLRPIGSETIAAGPLTFTVAGGGIYSVLAVNGPDTASAGIVLLDDFQ